MDKHQLRYVSWLASVNTALGRYIVRLVDEAAGHATTTYTTSLAEVGSELGDELMQLAHMLLQKGSDPADRVLSLENPAHPSVEPA